jgi:hypothetical protein
MVPTPIHFCGGNLTSQDSYPILARLARIYLAVPATSAPSERIFSRAQRLISEKRTALNPDIAGKLFFVAENWEWYDQNFNVAEAVMDEEDHNSK